MDEYFSRYDSYTENEIAAIRADGIELVDGKTILFEECVKYYALYNRETSGPCVGERGVADYSFTFYSSPHPVVIKFEKRSRIAEFFSLKPVYRRFYDMQKKLNENGYTTYDLT